MATLRAAGDVSITAEESGKRRGQGSGRRLNIRQLLLGDGQTARRLECFRMLGGDATVESTGNRVGRYE